MNQMQRHMANLGRLYGHKTSGGSKYSYIVNTDDLTNAYLQMRQDLGYPLMIDSKYRRAIVYNKEGLERKIQNMINEVLEESAKKLSDIVVADISYQLNNLTMNSKGQIVGSGNHSFNMASMLGSAIGKGLVKGFFNILDDITDNSDYDRRR